jgi:hypothetical protein
MDGFKRFPAVSRLGYGGKAEEAGKKEKFRPGFHLIEIKRWTTARAIRTVKLFDKMTPNWRENLQGFMGFVQLTGSIRPVNSPSVLLHLCWSFANKPRRFLARSTAFEQPNYRRGAG